jgi:hypothetical protein
LRADFVIDVTHRFDHTFSKVSRFGPIPQLNRFSFSRGRPGWDCGAAHRAGFQDDIRLHGGVSSGIQDFSCKYI